MAEGDGEKAFRWTPTNITVLIAVIGAIVTVVASFFGMQTRLALLEQKQARQDAIEAKLDQIREDLGAIKVLVKNP